MQFYVPTGYQLPKGYRDSVRKMARAFPLCEVDDEDVEIITDLAVKAVEDAIDAITANVTKANTDKQRAIVSQLATNGLESVAPIVGKVMREKIATYFTETLSIEELTDLMAKHGLQP